MVQFTVKGKDYPLSITTKSALNMEEKLGVNPINIILKMRTTQELPSLKDLLVILHFALQKYNHNISFNDTLTLFDEYCEEDGSIVTLLELILKAFQDGGLIKLEQEDPNL